MKHRKEFLMDDSTINYLENFREQNHLPTLASALAKVIREHEHRKDVQASKALVEQLAKQISKELEGPLTQIRISVNDADRSAATVLALLSRYFDSVQRDDSRLQKVLQLLEEHSET